MILNKDESMENTKSVGEAKGEDDHYGIPNPQCQKYQKVIAAETKTKDKEKENQGHKISTGKDKNHKNTSKTNKLETRHFNLLQEMLEGIKIEHGLKEEEQTENQQQLKEGDTENKKIAKRTNQKKPKEQPKRNKNIIKNNEGKETLEKPNLKT